MRIFILLLILLLQGCSESQTSPIGVYNERMYYMVFPVNSNMALERAIIVSGAELLNDNILYWSEDKEISINKDNLTLLPPENQELFKEYVNNLNQKFTEWGGDTDFRRVEMKILDPKSISMKIIFKNGKHCKYNYKIDSIEQPSDSTVQIGIL